jgi:hypothetical protein
MSGAAKAATSGRCECWYDLGSRTRPMESVLCRRVAVAVIGGKRCCAMHAPAHRRDELAREAALAVLKYAEVAS